VSIGAHVSSSGLAYDAFLHAVFTGFVLSMIVAHAPSELAKAVGGVPRYRSLFYLHLVILHASVVLRVSGDLVDSLARFRAWGGLLTAVALAAFAANTALARRSTDDA